MLTSTTIVSQLPADCQQLHPSIPNLGFHILAIIRRKLPEDWSARYNLTLVPCETFVQVPPYVGTLYKGVWIR